MFLNLKTLNCLNPYHKKFHVWATISKIWSHLEKSKINIELIDDAFFLDIAPWMLSAPTAQFDLIKFKKKQLTLRLADNFICKFFRLYPWSEHFFTDSSKTEEGVTAVAVSNKHIHKPYTYWLSDDSSVFTGELQANFLALRHVCHSKEKSFLVLSDSLSSKAIFNLKYDHPILVKILELSLSLSLYIYIYIYIWN